MVLMGIRVSEMESISQRGGRLTLEKHSSDNCYKDKVLFLMLGPSGSGKTTIGQYLKSWGIPELVSHTTREPRNTEVNGVSYYFVSKREFDSIKMVEYTYYNNNYYGTSEDEVGRVLGKCNLAFVVADRHGIEYFKKLYGNVCKTIYVYTPMDMLYKRMSTRGDTEENVKDRIEHGLRTGEFDNLDIADYCIINKDLDTAVAQLRGIVLNIM